VDASAVDGLNLDGALLHDGQRVPPVVAVAADLAACGDFVNDPRYRRRQSSAEQENGLVVGVPPGGRRPEKCLAPNVVISATFPSASRRTSILNARKLSASWVE
jgi:hypothetical protein